MRAPDLGMHVRMARMFVKQDVAAMKSTMDLYVLFQYALLLTPLGFEGLGDATYTLKNVSWNIL
jgi:hypothetical protein